MNGDESGSAVPQRTSRIRSEILEKMADVPLRRMVAEAAGPAFPVAPPVVGGVGAMGLSRAGLASIDFLPPEAVPSPLALAQGLPQETRRLCRDALALAAPAIEAARQALAAFSCGIPPNTRHSIAASIAAGAPSDGDTHDSFFNIRRMATPNPVVYVQSVLEAFLVFRQDLTETPVTIDRSRLAAIETGLLTILSLALGDGPLASPGTFPSPAAASFGDHAARRWIRGHQVFAALSQGLIAAMDRLEAAILGGHPSDAAVAAVVIGLDACAASLEFTGDFPDSVYGETIRPGMCPPYVPRGFSGLLSADHTHLVRRMKGMTPSLAKLRAGHAEQHQAIVAALGRVYDSHKHVCAKFVGTERSSLLMAGGSDRSSVEQLQRFKTMRIRSLG